MQISKDKKFSWRWKDGRYYGLHEKGVEDLKVFLENFWNHIDPEAKETNISSNPELIKQKRIIDLFSEDEKKIAELVVKGKSNKEIAADCFMNEKKVKQLNREMCEKLNLEKTDKKELAKIFTSYLIQ
ncbi:MAG TPA: LuxR C-terminal-related transcriptional regulator [Chitinophagaceae bacterium]